MGQRCAIRIKGRVQGVGFRPAMYRLARSFDLAGFVRNDAEGVWLEVEGAEEAIARFVATIPQASPGPARIDSLETHAVTTRGEREFRIVESSRALDPVESTIVPCDLAPCDACLDELSNPADRRYRYPFINCTVCGPRLTIVRDVPYDRANTTMSEFALCAECQQEYDDPSNRRFHAEPNACPACGPRLTWVTRQDPECEGEDALLAALRALNSGLIVAIKGAGGFVLACDATSDQAVARLRERKRRPDKPLAVMARSLDHIAAIAELSASAREVLTSPARPIVLLPLRDSTILAPSVLRGLSEVGLFLPPTPLQHLLLQEGPPLQVMTSGNVSDEPIAKDNVDAIRKLGTIADGVLVHDRDVHTRADDSVVRILGERMTVVRRARGFVPETISLRPEAPAVIAVGGQLKNTVCLSAHGHAIVSQHIGDLSHPDAFAFFIETIEKLRRLVRIEPLAVAHDLHPDYRSTRWAVESGLPRIAIQHHHAHIAACLAEHQRTESVLGIAFDGTGYGTDGELWGGEFLIADLTRFRRVGHLRTIALPGGENAVREPWRLGLSALRDAGESHTLMSHIPLERRRPVSALLESNDHCVKASSAGRWFDAVAAICHLSDEISYEGQAAIALESICSPGVHDAYDFALDTAADGPFAIDLRPTIRAIARDLQSGIAVATVAARFHETLAAAIASGARTAHEHGAPRVVVLTGGCFQNRRLLERTLVRLRDEGFGVLVHETVPSNDGGLSLGQAAIASARMMTTAPMAI